MTAADDLVTRSCAAQGIAPTVTDKHALHRLAAIFRSVKINASAEITARRRAA
jgi:hypothetical protein